MKPLTRALLTTLAAPLILAMTAPVASSQDLLVGGPDTLIHLGNPASGGFQTVGACGGIVVSMAAHRETTYIGDQSGILYKHSPSTGVVYSFNATADATALAVHGTRLLVGDSSGLVEIFDLESQLLISTLSAPISLSAMHVVNDSLFVGGSQGVVLRADLASGGPFVFWGNCGGQITTMTSDFDALIMGTLGGVVYRVNFISQAISSIVLGFDVSAMTVQHGDLLLGDSLGQVHRVDPLNGQVFSTMSVGSPIGALAVTEAVPIGFTYCYGTGCPCSNDDPSAGCINSTGRGARLRALGSASVSDDDLTLFVTAAPPQTPGLFFMGTGLQWNPLGDGVLCSGGPMTNHRFMPTTTSAEGFVAQSGFGASAGQLFGPEAQLLPGTTWSFQFWYRDPSGPCGTGSNSTNSALLTFKP